MTKNKQSLYNRFMRKWFTKTYVARGLKRAKEEYHKGLQDPSPDKREELRYKLSSDIEDWSEWADEIEDAELVSKAKKMGIYLDEIPLPVSETGDELSHYETGLFGSTYLNRKTRIALRAKVREYSPIFKKDRREGIALIIGLLGAATGLIALLRK